MTSGTPAGLSRTGKLAVVAFIAAIAGIAAYVRVTAQDPALTSIECRDALAAAAELIPLAKDEVAIFRPARVSENLGSLSFTDADGHSTTLASFRGKTLLVNFWATWCAPCRAEMPTLDRLQAERGNDAFQVVTVNLDADASAEREQAFLNAVGATHLALYRDPQLALTGDLKRRGLVFGLPTTILVDASGCRLGSAEGGADWSSLEAHALLSAAVVDG